MNTHITFRQADQPGISIYSRPCFIRVSSVAALLAFIGLATVRAKDVPLHGDSVLRFASKTDAELILGSRDRFIEALSPFDRQSRLEVDRAVSDDEFLQFVKSQAREWQADEIAKITGIVARLQKRLLSFKLRLPAVVSLVQTTGREEGGAAYCRGTAIILPHEKVGEPDSQLERLLTHELFHILSSHNPTLRIALYKIIGFQPCPPIELPNSLKPRKLTNPDAPQLDAYITLDVDGENVFAVPVLYASVDRFDVKKGGPFFRYLTFRLMAIEQQAEKWQPVLDAAEPRLLQAHEIPDYQRQIGANTQYIIHPDEILADNFVHVVQQTSSVRSPHITDALRQAISSAPR